MKILKGILFEYKIYWFTRLAMIVLFYPFTMNQTNRIMHSKYVDYQLLEFLLLLDIYFFVYNKYLYLKIL